MDVIKIGTGNMIVILTKEDMTKYRISPETLEGFGKETRSALRRIVSDAGEPAALAKNCWCRCFHQKKEAVKCS